MCEICSDTVYFFSERQRIELSKKIDISGITGKVIEQLYDDRRVDDKTKVDFYLSHWEPLKKAVEEGFGKTAVSVQFGTPNYEFLKQLQTNTAVFAIFKSHASMQDMAALLKDKAGNLRSREDFKAEAWKVDANYRGSKLDAEYDTGVRTARMAANWQKYQSTAKLYPNLKYVRTKAAKPDANHLAYVGIIAPLNSPFWAAHYPPNRWRCQCSVEQTDEAPTDIPNDLPPVPKEFAFNAGQTGKVFDIENSDYIKSVPPAEQPALIKQAKKIVNNEFAQETPYQPVYKSRKDGEVEAHPLAFDNNDFDAVTAASRALANKGHKIKILPDLSDPVMRAKLLPQTGIKPNKNPDIQLDDLIADIKNISESGKRTVAHALDGCRSQCNNAILVINADNKLTRAQVLLQVKKKLKRKEMQDFGEIWINYKGELFKYKK